MCFDFGALCGPVAARRYRRFSQDFPFDSAADVGETCGRSGPGAPQRQGIA
jgi:hypothetical protein